MRLRLPLATLLLPVKLLAQGEADAKPPGDVLGWHLVKQGENWQSITAHYLGSSEFWEDNQRLNATSIKNPHLLHPGQRVRVIVERVLPPRSAEVTAVERRVDKKPEPQPWSPANVGDRLRERAAVRTHERSSTELQFDDGYRLTVTEQSMVFLREVGSSLRGVSRDAIEIVEGEADLQGKPTRPDKSQVEIRFAGVTAAPKPGPDGVSSSRARQADTGAAQLMVFAGEGTVAAGGASVRVPRGMGTSVPAGGKPRDPEPLLPAPKPGAPARGSRWDFANPRFAWQAVAKAASYKVEVFRDAACTQLVERVLGIADPSWQPTASLPLGSLHWRVTAVANSGLDGYPSAAVPFAISSDRVDRDPPVVVAILEGAAAGTGTDPVLLGPAGRLRLSARDDASGVAEVRYRWDGQPWSVWHDAALEAPGPSGVHVLEFEASDRLGRASAIWKISVERDVQAPPSPVVR